MISLTAKLRLLNRKKAKTLRQAGFIPSVMYGPTIKNESIEISLKDLERAYKEAGESSLVELHIDSKKIPVLIYDIARDPVTLKPIHADFYAVDLKKEIRAKVPLVLEGEAPAVKAEGAILLQVMHDIEVEALPENLPHEIKIHVGGLQKIGDRFTVASLIALKGVKVRAHGEDIIAITEAPRAEEEAVAPVAAEAEAVVEVKTEQEIKKAEKEAKKKEEEITEKK